MTTMTRAGRPATPERWSAAARRAIEEGVEVRQINDSGAWVASSATDPVLCYLLEVSEGLVLRCSCPAGAHGDPCCKHAARFYLDAGAIAVDGGQDASISGGRPA